MISSNINILWLRQNGRHFADMFKCIFSYEDCCILTETSLEFMPKGPVKASIGSDNGLAPNRRQAIIWTNADPIHRCIYVALGGDELTQKGFVIQGICSKSCA